MPAAAREIAEFTSTLDYADIPPEVADAAALHLLDTIGCGLAAHALGVATEGRTAMAEMGGRADATVIGLGDALPAPNAALANAMLCHGLDFDDTHSGALSHVTTVTGLRGTGRGRGARRLRARRADRDRGGQRGRDADRHGRLRAVPRPRLPSDGRLRRLRRHRRRGADRRPGRGAHRSGPRVGRLHGVGTLRLSRRRHGDEASASGLGCARRPRRRPPGRPRRRGADVRARGPVRPLPRLRGGRAGNRRHRLAARRPRLALGDAADRLQAVPGLPLHARVARGRGRGHRRTGPSARRRSRTSWSRSLRPASAWCSSRRR